jgi:hypothetical protein
VLLDSKRLSCSVAERSSHDGVLDIRESNARLTDALADMDGTTGRPRNSRNGILRLYLPVVVLAGVATISPARANQVADCVSSCVLGLDTIIKARLGRPAISASSHEGVRSQL